ncbi:Ff.00g129830.m01.CDS01 [Fusarium sp. VM40]|nr:Ff.00g129830.m01.CDS01 [Fusarium sp. VM40]
MLTNRTPVEDLKKWNPSLADTSPCVISKEERHCVMRQDNPDEYKSSRATVTRNDSTPSKATPSATCTSQTEASTTKSERKTTPSPTAARIRYLLAKIADWQHYNSPQ